jgi:hypothetical protein
MFLTNWGSIRVTVVLSKVKPVNSACTAMDNRIGKLLDSWVIATFKEQQQTFWLKISL